MTDKETENIQTRYWLKFSEHIPLFYGETEDQYVALHEAAKKAIERGKKLSQKEVHQAIGLVFDNTVKY